MIIDFSGCDAVEVIFLDGPNYSRCALRRNHDERSEYEIVPCRSGSRYARQATDGPDQSILERLYTYVIEHNYDPDLPFFSPYGSFWTGNSDKPLIIHHRVPEYLRFNGLVIGGEYLSLILIPISAGKENIGLLCLFSRERERFSLNEVGLYESTAQALGVAFVNQREQTALRERVKELTCLYSIATLVESPDVSPQQILQGVADLLPPAWQYPEITSARIVFDGVSYLSPTFIEGGQKQESDIIVHGKKRGIVEVLYSEPKPQIDEGPFLREERELIDAVASQIALFIKHRQTEEDRLKLQDQLRHADRLATIGQLAAGVAHELNEPLGGILGFAQLAKKVASLPQQANDDLDKIVNAALHAREVVKKLMLFTRRMPTSKTRIDLNKMIKEGLYFLESRCQKAGIEMVRRLSPEIPKITADQSQIYQVLVNLTVNAVQVTPDGGRIVILTETDENHVKLIVEDNGPGMSQDTISKLFTPFFTTKGINEGTGLGLSIVHGIVTSHGGTIQVESETGQGSRFIIRLPVSDEKIVESN